MLYVFTGNGKGKTTADFAVMEDMWYHGGMAMKKKVKVLHYTAVFEPDKDVGGYTATIPALPGCISEGNTFEDALKNIQEAAELYLEVMQKHERESFIEGPWIVIAPVQVHAMA